MGQLQYHILIVDDNPFPTKKCIEVLLYKFKERFNKICTLDNESINEQFTKAGYNDVAKNYQTIRKKNLFFKICPDVSITLYNYDVTKCEEENQNEIIKLIERDGINIFWTDREYLDFEIKAGAVFKIQNENSTNSDTFFINPSIVKALKNNGIRQIGVYTFNLYISQREIEVKREWITEYFRNIKTLDNKDIYFLETSSILNIFESDDSLSDGKRGNKFLGTITAYEKYGNLLGNVLFDLFLQLKENKPKSRTEDERYNFFKDEKASFLSYSKLLNNNKFIGNYFKIGNVAFYGEYKGERNFLLDVPYKEYYKTYDDLLGKIEDKSAVASIYNLKQGELEGYIYCCYRKDSESEYLFNFKQKNIADSQVQKVSKFLSLLHTGIFYQPDFYDEKIYPRYPFEKFRYSSNINVTRGSKDICEIFYLIKRTNFADIPGLLHFSFWRRDFTQLKNIAKTVEEIWQLYYPLLEPKIEETLLPLLTKEIINHACKAAISQVMARNMSHNHGSHVLSRMIHPDQIRDLLSQHEGIRHILSEKTK